MVALFPDVGEEDEWGQIFMQAALYGYVLSIGADMIGDGAELLLLCPPIAPLVGSIVVPILGAVPDGMMVLCSGLGIDAQEQINVGVGALAGSTVMLLTLPWFLAIICGRVTIKDGQPNYKGADKLQAIEGGAMAQFSGALFQSGVGIHAQVKANSKFMFMTTLSYWVIQGPAFLVDNSETTVEEQKAFERPFAYCGAVSCILLFCWYMIKSFREAGEEGSDVQTQIVKKTVEGIQNGEMTLRGAMHDFKEATMKELEGFKPANLDSKLLNKPGSTGSTAEQTVKHMCKVLEPFFKKYDQNGDNLINLFEFKALMQDLRENVSDSKTNAIFEAADMDHSGGINFEEFVACIMAFALDPMQKDEVPVAGRRASVEPDEDAEEEEEVPADLADLSPAEQQAAIKKRACTKMFMGSVIVLLFSDPMCDLLGVMGAKAKVPPFYISFLLAPLASNASELVSAMKMASKKTQSSMKESLSSLCGAAIMNNSFCLSIFFVCVIAGDLVWKFSAEVISIVSIQYAIGMMAILKDNHRVFDGIIIILCYPAALGIVYVLKTYIGMD